MSDHAVDLHLAAITGRPGRPAAALAGRPGGGRPAGDPGRPRPGRDRCAGCSTTPRAAARRGAAVPGQRLRDALTTIGPLTEPDETDPEPGPRPASCRRCRPTSPRSTTSPRPCRCCSTTPTPTCGSPERWTPWPGRTWPRDPQLQLIVDAHAMRRYYERPEQPQQEPRTEPDPDAPPDAAAGPARARLPRPRRLVRLHARPAAPAGPRGGRRARRTGRRDDGDASAARALLDGATWGQRDRSRSPEPDLEVLPPRRTAVVVGRRGVRRPVERARGSGGLLPLGEDEWVVLDADPDASGLKLDQHARNLVRQYASEANGDPATSAPGDAALDRLRAGPPGAGRRSSGQRVAQAETARRRRRHPGAAARRPGPRHPGRGVGRRTAGRGTACTGAGSTVTGEPGGVPVLERRARRRLPAAVGAQPRPGRPRPTATTCTRSWPGGTGGACPRPDPG